MKFLKNLRKTLDNTHGTMFHILKLKGWTVPIMGKRLVGSVAAGLSVYVFSIEQVRSALSSLTLNPFLHLYGWRRPSFVSCIIFSPVFLCRKETIKDGTRDNPEFRGSFFEPI